MKRLRITVNGTPYDVQVEEIGGAAPAYVPAAPVTAPAAPVAAPAAAPAAVEPKEEAAPAPSAPAAPIALSSDAETVMAPMPGTILDVKVAAGEKVTRGQVLMILEAMKMENDITCPKDGTLAAVFVGKGESVNSGTKLFAIQ